MPNSNNTLCLDKFYPEKDLKITDIVQQKDNILIRMKSISKSCKCPKCNYFTDKFGKSVQLEICSHEYECVNDDCAVTSMAETFDGFLNTYSRMTERCADFILDKQHFTLNQTCPMS